MLPIDSGPNSLFSINKFQGWCWVGGASTGPQSHRTPAMDCASSLLLHKVRQFCLLGASQATPRTCLCMDRCLAFRLWKPYRRWENNLWYLLSRRIILGLAHKCIWIHVVTKLIKFGESLKAHTDNITPFYAINEQGSSQSVRVTLEEGVLRTCLKTRVFQ